MSKTHRLTVNAEQPPTVELDTEARAAYVRFRRSPVVRTEPVTTEGYLVTVDFDAAGDVVGIELVGVEEFGIGSLLEKANVGPVSRHLREGTRYVPASLQPA